jgi:hypothetical protein
MSQIGIILYWGIYVPEIAVTALSVSKLSVAFGNKCEREFLQINVTLFRFAKIKALRMTRNHILCYNVNRKDRK